jgi:hypothetical protein
MAKKRTFLQSAISLFGVVSLLWIVFDFFQIALNLESVIYLGRTGFIVGIGYLFILAFHLLALAQCIKNLILKNKLAVSITTLFFLIVSFLSLFMQKVMFDEVGREYSVEYPMPGETYFIFLGLAINALFILFVLKNMYRKSQSIQEVNSD